MRQTSYHTAELIRVKTELGDAAAASLGATQTEAAARHASELRAATEGLGLAAQEALAAALRAQAESLESDHAARLTEALASAEAHAAASLAASLAAQEGRLRQSAEVP